MTSSYTREELSAMQRALDESIDRTEREHPEARGLPPMAEDEAREMLLALTDAAQDRKLTTAESFLCGQLIAAYRMAIEARMIGLKDGRYYVVSESDLEKLHR